MKLNYNSFTNSSEPLLDGGECFVDYDCRHCKATRHCLKRDPYDEEEKGNCVGCITNDHCLEDDTVCLENACKGKLSS